MIREKRFEMIHSELAKRGVIDVEEIAQLLNASSATVRRDLDTLEKMGVLKRIHGGARAIESEEELPFNTKAMAYIQEKRAIGITAAAFIPDGSVIGCTGGTTTLSIIRHLKEKQITVITNAINVAMELAHSKSVEVVVSGGTLRSRSYEMVGPVADKTLSLMNLNIALIGVDGIDIERGISTYTIQEAHAASLFIKQARDVWVATDHSKIGKIAPAVIAPLSKVSKLFTDPGINPKMKQRFEDAGTQVIIAEL